MVQLVKDLPAMWETWVYLWVGKIPWRRERLPTPVFWPGEFNPWGCKERLSLFTSVSLYIYGTVIKNPPASAGDTETQVRSLGWEDPLEKEMATSSSILAWEIPWT